MPFWRWNEKHIEILVAYGNIKKFYSVSEYTTRNLLFYISGCLYIGENLLINTDTIEWSFLNPKNTLSNINNKNRLIQLQQV